MECCDRYVLNTFLFKRERDRDRNRDRDCECTRYRVQWLEALLAEARLPRFES